MKIGRFRVEQLSEGIFEVFNDGVFKKIDSGQITSGRPAVPGPKYSTFIGIDPILIRDGKHIILLDTGLGWGLDATSTYRNTSNLKTNLDIFGLTPQDVTHVVLTHLHFDHAAGSSFVDEQALTQPSMPFANYFVQKREWNYALTRVDTDNPVKGADYNLDEFYRLVADEVITFLDEDFVEIVPGVQLIWTGGHTPGHQIVKIQDSGDTAYYLGDLVPTEYHLNHYAMKQMDLDPIQAKKSKILLLKQAYEENACLLFYHSIHTKAGRLERDPDRRFILREIH